MGVSKRVLTVHVRYIPKKLDLMPTMTRPRLIDKPREVQERYWRRRISSKISPILKRTIRFSHRMKTARKERKKLSQINDTIDAVAAALKKFRKEDSLLLAEVYNATLFFLLAMRDIQALKTDAICNSDESVRKLSVRVIALTIYELDMSKVTGKSFQKSLDDLKIPIEIVTDLRASLRKLRKAGLEAQRGLKDLRLNAIAHRDRDSLKQYELIEGIDEIATINIASDFLVELQMLSSVLVRCVQASGSMRSLAIQAVAKIEANNVADNYK